jgi:hypothetical protein
VEGFATARGKIDKGKAQSSNSIGMIRIFWAVFIGDFPFRDVGAESGGK